MIDLFMQKMTVLWRKARVFWKKLVPVLLASVGVLGVVLFVLLFVVMFNECVEYWAKMTLGVEHKREVIEFIGWGIAGILAFFGAIAVNRRAVAQIEIAKAQVETVKTQSENNKLIETGHIQDRFKTAVEHLGSERETARVASFYEFYHLAIGNKYLRESILDILCAYLRQLTTSDKYKAEIGFDAVEDIENAKIPWKQLSLIEYADREKTARENLRDMIPTEEVRNLLDVLFQSKDSQGEWVFAGYQSNLQGAFLMKVMLQGANMWRAYLREADLRKGNLRGANLQDADLQLANLRDADLRDVDLQGANLQCAKLLDAKLQRAKLRGADLYNADLRGADLWSVDLQNASLENAKLDGVNLQGADLQGVDLRRVNLREVNNLDMAKLSRAKIKGARFPEGYKPPPDADTTSDEPIL